MLCELLVDLRADRMAAAVLAEVGPGPWVHRVHGAWAVIRQRTRRAALPTACLDDRRRDAGTLGEPLELVAVHKARNGQRARDVDGGDHSGALARRGVPCPRTSACNLALHPPE